MNDLYADASLYDILYTPGTAAEVDLHERIARRWVPASRRAWRWLEPACGSGRYLRVLGGRGHRVLGFDIDPAMVAYARRGAKRRGLERRLRVAIASMEDFAHLAPPASIDVAFVPVNTFRHLLDETAARRHLAQMARALQPHGIYVVGISLSRYEEEEPSEDVWKAARGRCSVRQIVQYLPADRRRRRETVYSHLQIRRPSKTETRDARYELRAYDDKQWRRLLRAAGFTRLEVVDDRGQAVGDREVGYQLEVLRPTHAAGNRG